MTIQPGTDIGRYHILEQLGEGGMAVVYKAYDTHLENEVAIKVIRMENILPKTLERALKRFQIEARKMSQLTHPNVVPVMDYGEYEGSPYLVMRYLSGGTLKSRLGQPMSWLEAARLLKPITDALNYAHSKGLIHRDIKPSNILITESGDPMLTDFGIAKILSSEETLDLTVTGMGVGTPEYMAPEQAEGKLVDERADVYSLGIVFYELVTGRKPFTADTPMAVIVKQMHDPLPQPSQFVAGLPVEVEHVLFKILAKDPSDRYQNTAELSQALGKLMADQIVYSKRETAPKSLEEKVRVVPDTKIETEKQDIKTREKKPFKWGWIIVGVGLLSTTIGVYGSLKNASSENVTPTNQGESAASTISNLGIGSRMVSDIDGMTLMYVPAGEFLMGSSEDDPLAYYDEFPQHSVYLDAFWIDQTEVTNDQYHLCVEAGACSEPDSTRYYDDNLYNDHPVVYVDWYDAQGYCQWVGRHLPTEAEWEKAARGTDGRIYPWGNNAPNENLLNFNYNIGTTTAVGNYPSGVSPYGVLDMAGNVWEWIADWYSSDYYASSPVENPTGPESGDYKAVRGGSWSNRGMGAQAANRNYSNAVNAFDDFGFRCALSL